MFSSPNVTRNDPCAISLDNPIATNTCDGSNEPDVHAEPDEAHIPFKSKFSNNASPSTPINDILAFPGKRLVLCPFNLTFGIFSSTCEI